MKKGADWPPSSWLPLAPFYSGILVPFYSGVDRTRLYSLLIGIPLGMAALAIALILLGSSPFGAGSLFALFDRHGGAGWLVDLDEQGASR